MRLAFELNETVFYSVINFNLKCGSKDHIFGVNNFVLLCQNLIRYNGLFCTFVKE